MAEDIKISNSEIEEILKEREAGQKTWYLYTIGSIYTLFALYLSYILIPIFYSDIAKLLIVIVLFSPSILMALSIIKIERDKRRSYSIEKKDIEKKEVE